MQLGTVTIWRDDRQRFIRDLRLADELGHPFIGVGDVPSGFQDLYVSLGIAAAETRGARLGSWVTSYHLRHPAAQVTGMSSIDDLTGGRAVLGLGAGNSIAHGIGQKHWPAARVRDYILTLRSLFRGEAASWDGGRIQPMRCARPVPVLWSAFGPKAMQLAGEAADGVILLIGQSIEKTRDSIATVRAAARAAGRDPAELAIWAHTTISIAESRLAALRNVAAYIATEAPMMAWSPQRMAAIPAELRAAVLECQRRYDVAAHASSAGRNGDLIEELGLLEYFGRERTIAGTLEEVSAHLRELADAGVEMLVHPMSGHRDPEAMVRLCRRAAEAAA